VQTYFCEKLRRNVKIVYLTSVQQISKCCTWHSVPCKLAAQVRSKCLSEDQRYFLNPSANCEVLTPVFLSIQLCWGGTMCHWLSDCRRFETTYTVLERLNTEEEGTK